MRARWGLKDRSDQGRFVLTQKRAIGNAFPFVAHARQAEAWREKSDRMVLVIDHRHAGAKASGTVMVVMIGRAFVFMRIAWARVVVVVVMIVTVLVHGGHDIAGIGHEGAAVHADEHADNHDGLEKESHNDAPKIGGRAHWSRHFRNIKARCCSERGAKGFSRFRSGPFLDMIAHDGFVVA
jgi:type IV secretory pathway VirB2 component (pilin)